MRRTLFEDSAGILGEDWLRGQRLLVACSGGADSLTLLALLELLGRSLDLTLVVAHIDHGLREASAQEAELVSQIAAERGLQAHVRRLDLATGPGLAERARDARRAALLEVAALSECAWVALGHTATDQLETVLMHVLRGAGLDGLAGMPVASRPWLRPILGLRRDQTAELAERFGFAAVDDPTNHDPRHLRVELREAMIPRLRRRNPGIERSVTSLARHAADADAALAQWSSAEEAGRRLADEGDRLRWRSEGLAELPRAVRTRVFLRIALLAGAAREALSERVIMAFDRALMAREAARGTHGAALRPHSWDLRPSVRIGLDRGGLWAQRPGSEPAPNH